MSLPFQRWAVLPKRAAIAMYHYSLDFTDPVKTYRTREEARKAAKQSDMDRPIIRKVKMRIVETKQ